MIRAFLQQLNGTATVRAHDPGTAFLITIPRAALEG